MSQTTTVARKKYFSNCSRLGNLISGGFVESVEDFCSVDGVEDVFGDDVVDVEDVESDVCEADAVGCWHCEDEDESEVADEDEDGDEPVNGWGQSAFCGEAEGWQGDCESDFWGVAEGAAGGAHEGAVALGVTHGDVSVVILGAAGDES